MSYQKVTGPLMASGYQKLGTQEATSDMYVVRGGSVKSNWDGTQLAPTLTQNNANGAQRMPDKENFNAIIEEQNMETVVRRLTPTECEALQGFPKDWTLIGEPEEVEVKDYKRTYDEDGNEVSKELIGTHMETEYFYIGSDGKKKKCSDSARYKALGNSIAVGYANNQSGFWMWLMKRISAEYERSATLGSLFDGISGFPLAWSRFNGAENCRWSSEIEEFPMAVCKQHFGDEDAGIEGDIKEYL